MRRPHFIHELAGVLSLSGTAFAIDHSNLDHNRPLRIEDAYAIAAGELVLEFGLGFDDRRNDVDQVFAPLELLWGAAPNLQLGIGSTFFTHPHDIDDQSKSGDVRLSVLYNFNQETSLPAFAIRGELNLPTGVDSSGADAEIAAILTKSIGPVSFHLNAGYEFFSGTSAGEEDGLYKFALGASLPLGAPMHTQSIFLADVYLEQAIGDGEDDHVGVEAGIRHQLTERLVLDGGIGTELAGPDDRSRILLMFGVSMTF